MEIRGGIGLAAERVALGPATLVTHTPYHAALRTPSRTSWAPGNALHLFAPPTELDRWWAAFDRVVGVLTGIRTERLAWEVPSTGTVEPDLGVTDGPDDLAVTTAAVVRLDGETDSPPLPSDVALGTVGGDEHRLAGARTLYLQGGWGVDVEAFRWRAEQEHDIARSGRGRLWVGYRYGIPIARVGVFHDRAGLAVVDGAVVHPLYRGQGVGAAVVGQAIDALRAEQADVVVVATVPVDSTAHRLALGLGARRVGTVVTVTRPH